MFHPDGYVSLRRVCNAVLDGFTDAQWRRLADEIYEYSSDFEYDAAFYEDDELEGDELAYFKMRELGAITGDFSMLLRCGFPADEAERIVWRELGGRIHLCSPAGQMMRLDFGHPYISFEPVEYWADYAFNEQGEFRGNSGLLLLQRESLVFHLSPADLYDRAIYAEDGERALALKSFMKDQVIDRAHSLISHFYNRRTFTISLMAYDHICENFPVQSGHVRDDHVANILRQFEGWSMCVPASVLDEVPETIQRHINAKRADHTNRGRSRQLRERAKAAYAECYPNGHDGFTMDQVITAIGNKIGRFPSADTVKRAIAELRKEQE